MSLYEARILIQTLLARITNWTWCLWNLCTSFWEAHKKYILIGICWNSGDRFSEEILAKLLRDMTVEQFINLIYFHKIMLYILQCWPLQQQIPCPIDYPPLNNTNTNTLMQFSEDITMAGICRRKSLNIGLSNTT